MVHTSRLLRVLLELDLQHFIPVVGLVAYRTGARLEIRPVGLPKCGLHIFILVGDLANGGVLGVLLGMETLLCHLLLRETLLWPGE